MKIGDKEFKLLQDEWYEALKANGFVDIETVYDSKHGPQLKHEHRRFYRARDKRNTKTNSTVFIDAKVEYYLRITHIVNDPKTEFKREMDRIIMILHSDGYTKVQIARFLAVFGFKRKRKSIIYLIRRYEHAWGLKKYTQKQMNRKPRKKLVPTI